MSPRRRSTDLDRRDAGLVVAALSVVTGWLLLLAYAFGVL